MPGRGNRYGNGWPALRLAHLAAHPLCAMCNARGRTVAATVADHIVPVVTAPERRLDPDNLQSLCASCHNSAKQSEERRGYSDVIGADGWPVDARHPARRGWE